MARNNLKRVTNFFPAAFVLSVLVFLFACGNKKHSTDIEDKFGGNAALGQLDTMMAAKTAPLSDTVSTGAALPTHNCDCDHLTYQDIQFLLKLNKDKKIDTLKSVCFSFVRVRIDSFLTIREYGRCDDSLPPYANREKRESIFIYSFYDQGRSFAISTYDKQTFSDILEKVSAEGKNNTHSMESIALGYAIAYEYQSFKLNGNLYVFYKARGTTEVTDNPNIEYVIFVSPARDYIERFEFEMFGAFIGNTKINVSKPNYDDE